MPADRKEAVAKLRDTPILPDILKKLYKAIPFKAMVYSLEIEQTLIAYPIRTVQQKFTNAKTWPVRRLHATNLDEN